jgi:CheY-like chemotaxis protein
MRLPADLTILLAEDDDGHAVLVKRNLERAGFNDQVVRLRDGVEALVSVRDRMGPGGDDRLVLLLDINMPRLGGIEVLRQLKADEATASIPVIMLTTTDDLREIEHCYRLGCNLYITKPVVYESFVEAITRLGMFLKVVRVPAQIRSTA